VRHGFQLESKHSMPRQWQRRPETPAPVRFPHGTRHAYAGLYPRPGFPPRPAGRPTPVPTVRLPGDRRPVPAALRGRPGDCRSRARVTGGRRNWAARADAGRPQARFAIFAFDADWRFFLSRCASSSRSTYCAIVRPSSFASALKALLTGGSTRVVIAAVRDIGNPLPLLTDSTNSSKQIHSESVCTAFRNHSLPPLSTWPNGYEDSRAKTPHYGERQKSKYRSGGIRPAPSAWAGSSLQVASERLPGDARRRPPEAQDCAVRSRMFLAWPQVPEGQTSEEQTRILGAEN
jgi:hypothetical protein